MGVLYDQAAGPVRMEAPQRRYPAITIEEVLRAWHPPVGEDVRSLRACQRQR